MQKSVVFDEVFDECCICFTQLSLSKNDYIKDICQDCALDLKETDENGVIIHPITRKPLPMCKCGKLWNATCRANTVIDDTFIIDTSKLCPNDPTYNMNYCNNPENLIPYITPHRLINFRNK